MKKRIFTIVTLLFLFLLLPNTVNAHPGRTDNNGGHTCKTNCERWGLNYGEYHYHNGGTINSPIQQVAPVPVATTAPIIPTPKPVVTTPKPVTPKPTSVPTVKPIIKPTIKPSATSSPSITPNETNSPKSSGFFEWLKRLFR